MLKKIIASVTTFLLLAMLVQMVVPPPHNRLLTLAQAQQFVIQQPDCQIFFNFNMSGSTSPTSPFNGLDNRNQGCDTWNMTYAASGFSAVSLALQGAANNNGSPGSYSTGLSVQQTVLAGVNPSISTTGGFLWVVGYSPWVRVQVTTTGSGVVNGAAYGWRIPSAGTSSTAVTNVTCPTPCDVNLARVGGTATVTGGVAGSQGVGGLQANGAALAGNPMPMAMRNASGAVIPEYGSSQAAIALSASGNTQIVALSGSTQIRITHISFQTAAAQNLSIVSGTGVACAGATTTVAGPYTTTTGLYLDFVAGPLTLTAGHALCISQSGANAGGGVVIYTQR